jgi:phthiocerol/phenolphthiocerol synthesis type-I polyketide synthase E
MTAAEAADPSYWARHLCEPVRFDAGVATLLADPGRVLLEVGPGQTLGTFVRQRPAVAGRSAPAVVASLRHAWEEAADSAYLLGALGRLWTAGIAPDWQGVYGGERRLRIPLPTYPFEHVRYWIGAADDAHPPAPNPPVASDPPAVMAPATEDVAADPPVAREAAAAGGGSEAPESPAASEAAPASPPAWRSSLVNGPSAGVARSPRDPQALAEPYVAPRAGVEQELEDLWGRLLGVDGIGTHDNFFELGGHSLMGTRLIARIRQEMGVELPIQALFRSPTVSAMAAEITEARLSAVAPDLLEQAMEEVLRLSPEQVRALLDEPLAAAEAS